MTQESGNASGSSGAKTVRRTLADGTVKTYSYARRPKRERTPTGALRGIFNAYSESPEFKRLCPEWRARKLWLFDLIEHELGWMNLADLDDRAARGKFYALRDKYAHLPHRADKMMQSLASALAWAYDRGMVGYNHAHRIGSLGEPRKHVAIYTDDMHARLLAELPEEMRWLYLLGLYTGARRSDLIGLRWDQIDAGGWLTFTPHKTHDTSGLVVSLPTRILAPLAELLRAIPKRGATILTQLNGAPWYAVNATKRWHLQMQKLGMVGMRFHDIRHSTATRLVEAGCTEAERGAVMGHAVAGGAGTVYVSRTRLLAENAYRKWNSVLHPGNVVPIDNLFQRQGKGGSK
jgi:integrase